MFIVPSQKNYSLQTTLHVEGHPIIMEIDIGAAVSIISELQTVTFSSVYLLKLLRQVYIPTQVKILKFKEKYLVKLKCHTLPVPILVVKTYGSSLIGRNWLCKLQLEWKGIFTLQG